MTSLLETLMSHQGSYSLPWLIKLWSPEPGGSEFPLLFVNSNTNVQYNGDTYLASAFRYTPGAMVQGFDGGGSLEIAAQEPGIMEGIEYFRNVRLDVVGVLRDSDGNIEPVRSFRHSYGKIEGDFRTIRFTFDKDERLGMTFNALTWNTSNNRGNA